jgi:hypothetical protein
MSFWQILKPQAGQNLIGNPSFEINATGWSAVNLLSVFPLTGANDRWQMRGVNGYAAQPSSTADSGIYYTTGTLTAAVYTFSIYGLFAANVPYQIRFADTSGTTVGTAVTFTGTGVTQRVSVTATLTAAAHRLYIQTNNALTTSEFFVDAAQLELGSIATTYIDGDQPGCTWDGLRGLSTSTRSGSSTAGGVWLDFETDLGIIPLEMQGVGMPPIDNVATPYALLPGARFERALARSRVFTILCLVPGSTWQNMHALREALIGRVHPDQAAQQQPIYLRYTGAAEPQIIAAFYDGGLEFAQPDGFAEQVPLRFVAHDPFWYSEKDEGKQFDSIVTGPDISYLGAMSSTGIWTSFASALNGTVDALLERTDGTIIVAGNFTNAGGVAAADYIARYNPQTATWTALGTGNANNRVRALAGREFNNLLIVGGDFTNIGGVAANRIAAYDPSTDTWSAYGTGANNTVNALGIAGNWLIAAGAFTTMNGVTVNRVAQFDGLTWTAIGVGLNGTANTLAIVGNTSSGNPLYYVGGAFTTAAGTTVNRIAYYNGSTFAAMGATGVNNTVNALALTSDGLLYVGGAFTTAGGVTANYIALWTGTGWQSLPSGPQGTISALFVDTKNRVYASSTGFLNQPGLAAIYQSGTWLPTFHAAITTTPTALLVTKNGTWYVGSSTTTRAQIGTRATITNPGTAPANAVARLIGNGVYNFTSQEGVYITAPLLDVEINSVPGQQTVVLADDGITRANQYLYSGSSFGALTLTPGQNIIAGAFGFLVQLHYRPRNWSLDV